MSTKLSPAGSLADFRRDFRGRYLAGPTWLHACVERDLFAVVLWGRPEEAHVRRLVASLMLELGPDVEAHRSIVDTSAVERVEEGAFSALSSYVHDHHAQLAGRVQRLALVRPGGLPGAAIAGFFRVLDPPYPVEVYADAKRALAWLGEATPTRLAETLAALRAELSGVPSLLAALRGELASKLAGADLEGAAKRIGMSSRTLQRQLAEMGTSFRAELIAARLREAESRMLDSGAPLTAIALDSGFATLQHFSAAFRKAYGTSPSAWRSQRRSSA